MAPGASPAPGQPQAQAGPGGKPSRISPIARPVGLDPVTILQVKAAQRIFKILPK
jgi:SWI/SNF-related matrix-associated actin-dependent regulator of chromatin subfamily A protein 2/4